MIFINDGKCYAKVWKITKSEKYLDLQISTSEKNRDGEWVNSRWFPRCVGHAFNKLKDTLQEGDTIIISKAKMSNASHEAKDGTRKFKFEFVILEANKPEAEGSEAYLESPAPQQTASTETTEDGSCPW